MEGAGTSFWATGAGESLLHGELAWLGAALEWVSATIDVLAILLLLIGALRFIVSVLRAELSREGADRVRRTNRGRIELGRYILAGLELLIVSDIIHSALSLAMADVVYLGLLVLIRSLISYFLDRELGQLRQELAEGMPVERSKDRIAALEGQATPRSRGLTSSLIARPDADEGGRGDQGQEHVDADQQPSRQAVNVGRLGLNLEELPPDPGDEAEDREEHQHRGLREHHPVGHQSLEERPGADAAR